MKEKISVNIYPTRTIIRDIPESYEKSIQKSLSVWNKVTFSYSFYAYKEELNEEDEDEATYNLIVPSGYNLKRIIASLSNFTLSKVIVNDYRLDYLNEEKTRKKKFKKVTNFSEPKDDIQFQLSLQTAYLTTITLSFSMSNIKIPTICVGS